MLSRKLNLLDPVANSSHDGSLVAQRGEHDAAMVYRLQPNDAEGLFSVLRINPRKLCSNVTINVNKQASKQTVEVELRVNYKLRGGNSKKLDVKGFEPLTSRMQSVRATTVPNARYVNEYVHHRGPVHRPCIETL